MNKLRFKINYLLSFPTFERGEEGWMYHKTALIPSPSPVHGRRELVVTFKINLMRLFILFPLLFISLSVHAHQKTSILRHHAQWIKPMDPNDVIHFTVWLKYRNKEQLDQRARDIYDPVSADYQHFVTQEEFNQRYAPAKEAEDAVRAYFTQRNMQASIVNHTVRVTAAIRQVEQAFHVQMNHYRYHDQLIFANATAPQLAPDIARYIIDISGLDNMDRYRPGLRESSVKSHDIHLQWRSFTPAAQPTTTSFVGFTGSELQTALNLAAIAPIHGTAINGTDQTIVIIDACGSHNPAQIQADANLYNTANGITLFTSANFAVINPDGTPYNATCSSSHLASWDREIALDVESSHTIAPASKTVLVLASSDAAPLDTAVYDVISILVNNNFVIAGFPNAYVVSNSWGSPEGGTPSMAMENTLELAAVSGISVDFSTGDCGDGTYNSSWPCSSTGSSPTVEYPASSAFTTAVGGTSLFVDNNWNYAFESLWGSYYGGAFYAGTTGGISQYYGPVSWQDSINSFVAGGYTSGTVRDYGKRALPDVAMLADPYTGLTIYEGSSSFVYGGTSLACPLFSATLTLVNQARALLHAGPNPIGQAAPYLYLNNRSLRSAQALHLIAPPHLIIDGAELPPVGAPLSAFTINDPVYAYDLTFGWDSSMTLSPENQFWNDGVGVGSPYLPNFIPTMASF